MKLSEFRALIREEVKQVMRENKRRKLRESTEPEDYIDVDKMQQKNRYYDRNPQNMYKHGEKIIVPLKRPIGGKKELMATVYKDGGFTSFSFEDEDIDKMEEMGLDYNDLNDFMEESMF